MNLMNFVRKKYHYGRYKKVKLLINKNKCNLLDIGCGRPCECMDDGSFLKSIGCGVGLDLDIKKAPVDFKFIKGNIVNLPFSNKTFDAVTSLEVFEHLDSVEQVDMAINEIKRVLKKDGIFIMSTPNNSYFWRFVWFFWEKSVGKLWREKHKMNLNQEQWLSTLEKKFKIISMRTHWGVNSIIKMKN